MIIFRIKEVREYKGITQYRLSKMTNISRSYLYALENHKKYNITLQTLLNIADALGVNIKELFYTELDLKYLREQLYKTIDTYGINSKEAIDISNIIDLITNIKLRDL